MTDFYGNHHFGESVLSIHGCRRQTVPNIIVKVRVPRQAVQTQMNHVESSFNLTDSPPSRLAALVAPGFLLKQARRCGLGGLFPVPHMASMCRVNVGRVKSVCLCLCLCSSNYRPAHWLPSSAADQRERRNGEMYTQKKTNFFNSGLKEEKKNKKIETSKWRKTQEDLRTDCETSDHNPKAS